MRAVVCVTHGDPELLEIEERPDPEPGPGEVVVDVAAAAVNFPDVLIVANLYQIQVPTPFVPGSEFAGIVSKVASDVTTHAVGDRVFGGAMSGAFADQVCVAASTLVPVPEGVALTDAAAFWVAYATSYQVLRSVADVKPGETVLVLGAAGGVGLAAVELAKVLGADVIAAASTGEKLAVCVERGASDTINYQSHNLRDELRRIAPKGVDVVVDPVGGGYSEQALRALRQGGRFVVVGFASGEIPSLRANLILLKSAKVLGFELRTYADIEPELSAKSDAELLELLALGRVKPHLGATFSLADTAKALRYVADRKATGKIVIVP